MNCGKASCCYCNRPKDDGCVYLIPLGVTVIMSLWVWASDGISPIRQGREVIAGIGQILDTPFETKRLRAQLDEARCELQELQAEVRATPPGGKEWK